MASDDWGCGSSFGEAKSLSELVEGLTSKKIQENHTDSLSFPAAEAENQQVQVVPCVLKIKNTAPKILKKKSSINKMNREPNLKKVTFEVEQLLARESSESVKNEATERLVISLGGLPSKRKNINYKLLKDHLATKKDEKKTKETGFSPNRVIKNKNKKKMPRSRSRSMSRSRGGTPIQRSRSPSRSRSPPLRDEYRRRTPSPSRRYSRKSRSRTPDYRIRHGGGNRRGGAWAPNRSRENPDPSRCVGIFNLSLYTTEKDLKEVFGKYGDIDKVELVYDHPTGRSRGFGFVYFTEIDSATNARDELNGSDLDGHKIRVDYSITKRAHTPTPGQYMGGGHGPGTETGPSRPPRGRGGGGRFGGDRDSFRRRESYREGYGGYGGGHRRRSPSPPPRRRRSPSPRRYRSRSRSY